jgi:hypothetical protein
MIDSAKFLDLQIQFMACKREATFNHSASMVLRCRFELAGKICGGGAAGCAGADMTFTTGIDPTTVAELYDCSDTLQYGDIHVDSD